MHNNRKTKIRRALGLKQNIVQQLSCMLHEVAMRWERVVPGENDIVIFLIELKDVEIKLSIQV